MLSLIHILPADYQAYVRQMQESFAELDAILDDIDGMTEGELCDRYLVKSVFYTLYFGADRVRLETDDYKKFADCFVAVSYTHLDVYKRQLIQIAVGSLYMFSVPRGYIVGFTQWCKQVIGCLLYTSQDLRWHRKPIWRMPI